MEYRPLGRSGVRVSAVTLGTATFGVAPTEGDVSPMVQAAIDLGINFFDTANTYGNQPRFDRPGATTADARASSEELLGKALLGRRDDVVLATKVSEAVGEGPNDGGWDGGGLSRRHIVQQVEQSLRRLGTDYIDIYYAHHPDPLTPLDESMRAFEDLIRAGKVRYAGLSTYSAWEMVDALWTCDRLGAPPPVCNQVMYNLVTRRAEEELVPACRRTGLSLVAFSPLAAGLLAGEQALSGPVAGWKRFGGSVDYPDEQRAAAQALDRMAHATGYGSAQLALAWLLRRPCLASVIVGAESVAELTSCVAATDIRLDDETYAELDAIGRPTPPFPF